MAEQDRELWLLRKRFNIYHDLQWCCGRVSNHQRQFGYDTNEINPDNFIDETCDQVICRGRKENTKNGAVQIQLEKNYIQSPLVWNKLKVREPWSMRRSIRSNCLVCRFYPFLHSSISNSVCGSSLGHIQFPLRKNQPQCQILYRAFRKAKKLCYPKLNLRPGMNNSTVQH